MKPTTYSGRTSEKRVRSPAKTRGAVRAVLSAVRKTKEMTQRGMGISFVVLFGLSRLFYYLTPGD